MEIDLTGRSAIVTGSGRGIGEAIALMLAEAGANVVAAARTTAEIEDTVDRVRDAGTEGLAVPTDLHHPDEIEELVGAAVAQFGCPEILVNNAALNFPNNPDNQTVDEMDSMASVNLRAVHLLSRSWARAYRETGGDWGRIVNIASNSAFIGVPTMTYYGATNAGVHHLTRGFAATLASEGVTVNSVTPGLTRVDRIDDLLAMQERGEIERIHDLTEHPLGRAAIPEEVAYACLIFLHDLAGYITGADLVVDGGLEFTRPMYTIE